MEIGVITLTYAFAVAVSPAVTPPAIAIAIAITTAPLAKTSFVFFVLILQLPDIHPD